MNLRILKKLSKRAAPLLPLLGHPWDVFPAGKYECYTGIRGHDRKHWERHRARYPMHRKGDITYRPTTGNGEYWIVLRDSDQPIKGTPMVGAMCGYYEPEWEEKTAWEALVDLVYDHFCDWDENGPKPLRDLSEPGLIFRAAAEILATKH